MFEALRAFLAVFGSSASVYFFLVPGSGTIITILRRYTIGKIDNIYLYD